MAPGRDPLERRRALRLACALLAGGLALALACERAEPGRRARPEETLAARRQAAAHRGIESLIERRDEMGTDWTVAVFGYLVPLVQDPALAARCRAILEQASRVPIHELPGEFRDPRLLSLPRLRPIVAELLRRKRVGEPYEQAAAALGALLASNPEAFWGNAPLLQQLTFLHSFEELGIGAQRSLDDVVRELRAVWTRGDPERLLATTSFMFALTHVFYVASGYMRQYPDPARFEPEIAILRRALRRYLTGPVPAQRHFLDVQAEVLFALKLARVPEDDDLRAMAERLLALQKPDGSWGTGSSNDRTHATAAAVQALIELPAEFPAS